MQYAEVLSYWFAGSVANPSELADRYRFWFRPTRAEDADVATRFGGLLGQAAAGTLDAWARLPRGALAVIVLLDQLPRNVHRGRPAAFATDPAALALSERGIAGGLDADLREIERAFFYMPFQHAEQPDAQRRSIELYDILLQEARPRYRSIIEGFHRYAVEHQRIIERFGRFPHRNRILGRRSSPAERRYLAKGASTFGQG